MITITKTTSEEATLENLLTSLLADKDVSLGVPTTFFGEVGIAAIALSYGQQITFADQSPLALYQSAFNGIFPNPRKYGLGDIWVEVLNGLIRVEQVADGDLLVTGDNISSVARTLGHFTLQNGCFLFKHTNNWQTISNVIACQNLRNLMS